MPKCHDLYPGPEYKGLRCIQAAPIPPLGHSEHYANLDGKGVTWVNHEYVAPPRLVGRRDQEDRIQELVVRSRAASSGHLVPLQPTGPLRPSDPDYETRLAPGPTKPYPTGEIAGPMLGYLIDRGEEGSTAFHLEAAVFPGRRPSTISSARRGLAKDGWVVVTTREIETSGPGHTGKVAVYWERFNEMVVRTPPAALRAQPKDRPKGEVEGLLEEFG